MTPTGLACGVAVAAAVAGAGELLLWWWERRVAARDRAVSGAPAGARTGRAEALLGALALLGRRLGAWPAPADLRARLAAAGAPAWLGAREAMAAKVGAAALSLPLSAALAPLLPGRLGLAFGAVATLGAFLLPDRWLVRRRRARARAMARTLPELLDLLRVAVEAGLGPGRAFAEVARRLGDDPLAREWRAAAAAQQAGVPRAAALARLVERCPLPEIPLLAAAIERSERHGSPLAPVLAELALDARSARARRLRAAAARAAPKIQLVIALGLVPAAMLLLAAGMLARVA